MASPERLRKSFCGQRTEDRTAQKDLTGVGLRENLNEPKHISRVETAIIVFKMVKYTWKDQQAILFTLTVSYF